MVKTTHALPVFTLLGSALAAFPHILPADNLPTRSVLATRAPSKANNTIVQLFEWNWDSVAAECTAWLGPAGYGYAQVSPPQEHIVGVEWYTDYQPVSHTIQSKRGTRAQFAAMVTACAAAGVDVIVDAVLNHMTAGSGTGVAGNAYTQYSYPDVPYTSENFHAACDTDWTNATSTYDCQLDGLADLATETAAVQALEAAYLADLMSLGVAGFRLDAAKSMDDTDIAAFLALLPSAPYIVQEVQWGDGDAVTPNMYTNTGDVHEFRACWALGTALLDSGGLSSLLDWPGEGWVDSANAVIFAADHDTERTSGDLTYSDANNAYTLANIFVLAQPYGSPTVLSGYEFSTYDQGSPLDSSNNSIDVTCYENGWRCDHRWTAISNMVQFHNAVAGTAITNSLVTGTDQISFGRGAIGHVAMNYESTAWTVTLATDVPDGSYCEIIHDTDTSFTSCSSTTITVASGSFTVTVPAYDAIAIFIVGGSASDLVAVTFSESATTTLGQTVVLTGSIPELGDWVPSEGIFLTDTTNDGTSEGTWVVTVQLPSSTTLSYKFAILEADGTVSSWEADPNRALTTPATGSSTVTDTWQS